MKNQNKGKLLIIVPVTRMAGKLKNFSTWIGSISKHDVKVLVVHDYADDGTSNELKEIISIHAVNNVELIEEVVQSPGFARNIGLREKGFEWISFADSDDLVDVSTLLQMIENAPFDTEIIVGDYAIHSEAGIRNMNTSKSLDPKMNVAMNPGFWRMIFRQEVIGTTRFTPFKMGEDQLFLLNLDFFNKKIFFSNLSPYVYFENIEGQLTSNFDAVKDISNVIKQTTVLLNNSDSFIQKYIGVVLLRQIITEFKSYMTKNIFIAIYKSVLSVLQIKLRKFPVIFRCLYLILFNRETFNSKVTYSVLTGGLGNQLFQYAAALSRNSSQILLDRNLAGPRLNLEGFPVLSDFKLARNVNLLPYKKHSKILLKCSNYIIRLGVNSSRIERSKLYSFLIKTSFSIVFSIIFKTRLTLIHAEDNGYYEMKVLEKNDLLIGYFQSYKWASEIKVKAQLCNLKLINESEMLVNFLKQYAGKSILSIHVRLGDYKSQQDFGLIDRSYYRDAIKLAKSKMHFEYIWLFSDEPSEALDILPIEIIDQVIVVPNFGGSAAETLEAMRHAKSYIIANSSLSWWGAFLSYSSEAPLVIAPNPWFKNALEPRLITNPSWIRLPAWPHQDN